MIRVVVLAVAFSLGSSLAPASDTAASTCGARLGPSGKQAALLAQPDSHFVFIVRGNASALARARVHAQTEGQDLAEFPGIDGLAASLPVGTAVSLCNDPGLRQLWYLHPRLADAYVQVLKGIEYAVRTMPAPGVLSMSLGPPEDVLPMAGDDSEPMHVATQRAADQGLLTVIAIGNSFVGGGAGVVNPWCRARWVVCVGAASADGKTLWTGSSRGDPADPATWPDVVAFGVDVIGPWLTDTAKSGERRRYDEANADFIRAVPPDKRELYTLATGTSHAVPQVSRAAAQIAHFVRALAQDKGHSPGDRLFALEIPVDRFEAGARRGARLAGTVVQRTGTTVEVEYRLVEPWMLIKQLLMDTAIPMPGYAASEVGAGFVSPDYVEAQFSAYGVATPRLLPVKVR